MEHDIELHSSHFKVAVDRNNRYKPTSVLLRILGKVKQSHYRPGQASEFQEVEAPRFQDNRHIKVVRLSAIRTGRLYPQEIFLVLTSVRG